METCSDGSWQAKASQCCRMRSELVAKVLIVDDDARFRRVVGIALRVRGYEVREAADGREAVRQMTAAPADIVLLDWQMPGMNGAETSRAIREVSQAPVIVVSALDRCKEALAHGLNGSLTKPVDVDTLVGRIESALRKARS